MGIPGAGKSRVAEEYVARGYVRLNRDERGGSLRELAGALDETLASGVAARRARQHVPHARVAELRDRGGGPARVAGSVRLARHAARPGAGQPRRAAARASRLASRAPRSCASWRGSRACSRRPPRCARSASSSRRRPTRGSPASSRCPSRARRLAARACGRLRRGRRAEPARLGERARAGRPGAPHLVFDWSPDGDVRRRSRRPPPASRPRSPGAVESALCPHAARPADLLVPAAASGAAARVRARARRRPVALDPRRHRARAPHARDDARRALRGGLSRYRERGSRSSTSSPSSPVLRTIQCVSCLTTSISISGV